MSDVNTCTQLPVIRPTLGRFLSDPGGGNGKQPVLETADTKSTLIGALIGSVDSLNEETDFDSYSWTGSVDSLDGRGSTDRLERSDDDFTPSYGPKGYASFEHADAAPLSRFEIEKPLVARDNWRDCEDWGLDAELDGDTITLPKLFPAPEDKSPSMLRKIGGTALGFAGGTGVILGVGVAVGLLLGFAALPVVLILAVPALVGGIVCGYAGYRHGASSGKADPLLERVAENARIMEAARAARATENAGDAVHAKRS